MRASLDSSNGELWDIDHVKPPSCLSIMSLTMECASGKESVITRYKQSSTNPMVVSFLCLVVLMSRTL